MTLLSPGSHLGFTWVGICPRMAAHPGLAWGGAATKSLPAVLSFHLLSHVKGQLWRELGFCTDLEGAGLRPQPALGTRPELGAFPTCQVLPGWKVTVSIHTAAGFLCRPRPCAGG